MTLTSLPFILFLALVLAVYNLSPKRWRVPVLLFSSYLFYAGFMVWYLMAVLLGVTLTSHFAALLIGHENSPQRKLRWLWAGISMDLLFLVGLRYLPPLAGWAGQLFHAESFFSVGAVMTIGVSYYVFQGISYLTDVYLELIDPEPVFARFALYMAFFPKLLQGPIERGDRLLPQLDDPERTSWNNFATGGNLIIWGLFKKSVVADYLATLVDPVFGNVTGNSGMSLVIATYLFAFQIFLDFSGYTDIALGAARFFNIELTQNFNSPYVATSIADFWRRWHISFSSWILDYIFKPLQFSLRQHPQVGSPLALLITFLASGLWHGASWCYMVWGLVHGIFMAAGSLVSARKQSLFKKYNLAKNGTFKILEILITFNMVCFAWIFFRAKTLADALHIVKVLPYALIPAHAGHAPAIAFGGSELLQATFLIALTGIVGLLDRTLGKAGSVRGGFCFMFRIPVYARSAVYAVMGYAIMLCGAKSQGFIYLQF